MTPRMYVPAEWRCTLPPSSETGRLGVGFNLADGEVIRLELSRASARNLAESLAEYLSTIDAESEAA
jgi:hypothetical protein